jgi:soluble lytic murein transglycosylase-like protein
MLRIPHYLTFVIGTVILTQPALAGDGHVRRHTASAYHYRVQRTALDTASSSTYGTFGGYGDAAASARYAGPNARHYFGAQNFGVPADRRGQYESMVEQHASANGVPASLVHRVIMRESGYNPGAVSAGNYGMMQIRLGTARAMGYSGSAAGLLDAETNMTYAVRYLAGAYRAAHGNESLAVALYARGYNAASVQ